MLLKNIMATGAIVTGLMACAHSDVRETAMRRIAQPTTLSAVKAFARGAWQSISIELRPSEDRTGQGTVQPVRLKRRFEYLAGDKFIGTITMFADNYGQAPLMEFEFRGSLKWGEAHPIAQGAFNVDYVLDEGFGVTPLMETAAALLNRGRPEGLPPFVVGQKANILRKAFPLFNISEGQTVVDYDLIYFQNGMLFMGAKHVDGTPFDEPERRPHQLQVPLMRAPS
ncbi:MAG: hypothetical protein AAFN74_17475 [Myxococcota bacterium]